MNGGSQVEPMGAIQSEPVMEAVDENETSHLNRAREGELCPNCGRAVLEYDGLLNLVCTSCHFSEAGCFT
jgi:hypothetical protein